MSEEKTKGVTPSEEKISELSIKCDTLEKENQALKERNAELEKDLKTANDVIEGDLKARLAADIMPNSNYTVEDLGNKSLDELKAIAGVLKQAKVGSYKGIRVANKDALPHNLTVPDLYKFGRK